MQITIATMRWAVITAYLNRSGSTAIPRQVH
jgi:hypothetical protein